MSVCNPFIKSFKLLKLCRVEEKITNCGPRLDHGKFRPKATDSTSGAERVYKLLYRLMFGGRTPHGPAGTLPIIRLEDSRLRVTP